MKKKNKQRRTGPSVTRKSKSGLSGWSLQFIEDEVQSGTDRDTAERWAKQICSALRAIE